MSASPRPVARSRRAGVLYLRQSISRDDSISVELQETAGREHCERNGIDVIAVVSDPNRTGRTLARRQVQAVIGYVERGEADVIVLWKWSRIARNRKDFAVVADLVEGLGGTIESSTEPLDTTTAAGRFARGMFAEMAAFESERIGETWVEAHDHRRNRGVPAQGGDRFGYVRMNKDTFVPDADTGLVLAQMYWKFLRGAGFVWIARWLNQRGVPNRLGNPWTRDRVKKVLDSGFGAGLIIHHQFDPKRRRHLPGIHQPVITKAEWERYRRQREVPRSPAASAEPRYLLSGWLKCGDSLHPMHACRLGSGVAGYGYWCSRWAQTKTACRCITVTRAKAERAVHVWLAELAADIDAPAERITVVAKARAAAQADVRRAAARLAKLDEKLDRLTMGHIEGRIPADTYERTRDKLQQDRRELTTQQEAAAKVRAVLPVKPKVPEELLTVWPGMTVPEQRTVLLPLLDRVEVHRSRNSAHSGRSQVWLEVVSTWGDRFTYRE